jgi:hypothetical protein
MVHFSGLRASLRFETEYSAALQAMMALPRSHEGVVRVIEPARDRLPERRQEESSI